MFCTLSGVTTLLVLPQLDILCTSATEQHCAKNDNSSFIRRSHVTCFPAYRIVFVEERNFPPSIWLISYRGELCKNCVAKTSEMFIVRSAFCYTTGYDKPARSKREVRPTATKRGDGVYDTQYDVLNS